jgi:undecaprenyl pyrophosphate synthase
MFIAHGIFQVKDSDHQNIIIVDATGPFNHQAVHIYRQQIVDRLPNINGYWAQLNIANQNCLYTPEAELELLSLTAFKRENGMRFAAVLFKECLCKTLIEEKIKKFYYTHNIICKIFLDQNEAMHWLTNSLNQANNTPQATCA